MKMFFTKRHEKSIKDKKLPLYLPETLRCSILRTLEKYSNWGGWNSEENFTFTAAEEVLKTFYGSESLFAYGEDRKRVPAGIPKVILKGWPGNVMDIVEAWFDQTPENSTICEKDLNDIFAINDSPWRFVNGEAILVNSEYLHEEVCARTLRLLKENQAHGALEEYQEALQDLQSGQSKDAVVKAHKSVESVMKCALGTDEHHPFGKLLAALVQSDIIPSYYEEFFVHFEKLALGAVKERNLPGRGHGQGSQPTEVSRELAEFAIHLAGSMNLFIIQRWLDKRSAVTKEEQQPDPRKGIDGDIPF